MQIFNENIIYNLYLEKQFNENLPFPYINFSNLLDPYFFYDLAENYPSITLLKLDIGTKRDYKQRPHDRFIASYAVNKKLLGDLSYIDFQNFSPVWQKFINEIYKENSPYRNLLKRYLGCGEVNRIRLDFHVSSTGHDVSPHFDSPQKFGTHIWYFNTNQNWKEEWGGQTLILGGKSIPQNNPEISDFTFIKSSEILENKSLLFKNIESSWHAVDKIACPDGVYRRILNIVVFKKDKFRKKNKSKKRKRNKYLKKITPSDLKIEKLKNYSLELKEKSKRRRERKKEKK